MMAMRCPQCGNELASTDRFCAACGSPVPEEAAAAAGEAAGAPAPEPAPADVHAAEPAHSAAAAETPVSTLFRWARIAKTAALLAFLLPWVTVSCAGQPLISLSGVSLATGQVSMRNPVSGAVQSQNGSAELLVILALVALVAALVASFVAARRTAALASVAGPAVAAVLIVVEVFVRLPQHMREAAAKQGASPDRLGNFDASSMARMIQIDTAIGFWLTLAALGAAIYFGTRIRRRVAEEEPPPAP